MNERAFYLVSSMSAHVAFVARCVRQPPVPSLTNGVLAYGPRIVAKRTVRVEATRTARRDVALGAGPSSGR